MEEESPQNPENDIQKLREIIPPDDVYLVVYFLLLGISDLEYIVNSTLSDSFIFSISTDELGNIIDIVNQIQERMEKEKDGALNLDKLMENW